MPLPKPTLKPQPQRRYVIQLTGRYDGLSYHQHFINQAGLPCPPVKDPRQALTFLDDRTGADQALQTASQWWSTNYQLDVVELKQ